MLPRELPLRCPAPRPAVCDRQVGLFSTGAGKVRAAAGAAKAFPWARLAFLVLCWGAGPRCAESATPPDAHAVEDVLDRFHAAAARADGAAYFALFAPEAVFIGTDAGERWTLEQFRAFALPYFQKGKGWTYVPTRRHVQLSPQGDIAWFDEILNNAAYGVCRGSGVLRRIGPEWRICQYHLTIPIPNALASQVVKLIREQAPARVLQH